MENELRQADKEEMNLNTMDGEWCFFFLQINYVVDFAFSSQFDGFFCPIKEEI